MNSHIWKCPQCEKHTNIDLKDYIIDIDCQCGYHSTMNIKEFIKDSKIDKSKTTIKDDTFKDMTTDIKKGNEHLLTYFKEFKDKHINLLISLMNQLESSYEKSFNRNKDIVSFLEILIYNYDRSKEMKKNILKNDIKIYQCNNSNDINEVIKYYNEYNIILKKEINIEEVKTITTHISTVNSLLLLKDGRVASCSLDKTIRIYDPSNDYHCDQVIKRDSDGIPSICELDDGTIVSGSWKTIIIGDYTIKNAHECWINKVITLPYNRIASCSDDETIKIWKSNPPYSDKAIKVLEGHRYAVHSLLYIKERDIMISGSGSLDRTLRLWNMSTYQCDNVIEGVECSSINSLYQIDKDRVIVGGFILICIVNIDECVIEKTIEDRALGYVNCFLKLRYNKTILCGCEYNGKFCFYNIKTEEYRITRNNHKEEINDLLLIDDNTFLSCSEDKTIKVWKY